MSKTLWELIEDCSTRGRIDDVVIRQYATGRIIGKYDTDDAIETYGESLAIKHRRNRTHLTVWIA